MASGLKLRAEDAEDLKIVAACLQDAIVPIVEVCYLPERSSFLMVANRFKWESAEGDGPYERTHCVVTVLGVTAVRRRRVDLLDRALVLDLLTMAPGEDGLDLIFAGGAAIHLTAPGWRCLIEDIGEPWPAAAAPHHGNGDPPVTPAG